MIDLQRANAAYYEMPDYLYRSADTVREDITNIKRKISEVKRSFSIRELMLDMLSYEGEKKPSEWLYDLEALLAEAEAAYGKLSELKDELNLLEAELGEARCRIRL